MCWIGLKLSANESIHPNTGGPQFSAPNPPLYGAPPVNNTFPLPSEIVQETTEGQEPSLTVTSLQPEVESKHKISEPELPELSVTEENGSCEYPIDCSGLTSVLVSVSNGDWPSEVSLELAGFSGGDGETSACIEDGCVSFKMYDSYGDGWDGSVVTITTSIDGSDIILLTGTLDDGSEGTLYFGLNYEGDCGPVYGCMDINALNFNPAAVQDDGSCQYPISGCTDSEALNFNVDAEIDDSSCYYDYDILDVRMLLRTTIMQKLHMTMVHVNLLLVQSLY